MTDNHAPTPVPGLDGLLLSLIADALSLGPHWIYRQKEIALAFGEIDGYRDPATAYHPGKTAGDLTHYGDQVLVLLRSIAKEGSFDLEAFARDWRAFWEDPSTASYRDGATRSTLEHLRAGGSPRIPGSQSNDLAGAGRIAPLCLIPSIDEVALMEAARAQTAFTHGYPVVAEAAVFFTRVVNAIRTGASIHEAVEQAGPQANSSELPLAWIEAAKASAASSEIDRRALKEHGLTCHAPEGFPATLHLLLRYPDDPATALKANAEAGGDSAARGLLLGYVYGNTRGLQDIPREWIDELKVSKEVATLAHSIQKHG